MNVPGNMNCAFALDKTNHLAHRIFWWNFDAHMHMVKAKVPFYNFTFLLSR